MYLPIHCGKAISNADLGIQGDDTGDNISHMNPHYCELTAMYWAWKNLKNVDYIGLCHYRRYFKINGGKKPLVFFDDLQAIDEKMIDASTIPSLLNKYDVILPNHKYNSRSVYELFNTGTIEMLMQVFIRVLIKMHPEYSATLYKYLNGNKVINYNMFISDWHFFDSYCTFLFPVLDAIHLRLKPMHYTYYNRLVSMFAEILLVVYCFHEKCKIKQVPVIYLDQPETSWKDYIPCKHILNRTKNNLKFTIASEKKNLINRYWDMYLKQDNIII